MAGNLDVSWAINFDLEMSPLTPTKPNRFVKLHAIGQYFIMILLHLLRLAQNFYFHGIGKQYGAVHQQSRKCSFGENTKYLRANN